MTDSVPTAIDFLQRSLAISEKLDLRESRAFAFNNLGLCYQKLGDIPKAIDFFQRSLATFRAMGLPESHPNVQSLLTLLEDTQ